RQRHDGGRGERLVSAKRPDRVANVLLHVVEPAPAPDVARGLVPAERAAEAARVGHHGAMRVDLRTQFVVAAVTGYEIPDTSTPLSDRVHGSGGLQDVANRLRHTSEIVPFD